MFLPVAIVYRNGNRILRDQYSYLRNDVPGKKPGYSQAQGIGWGAWDARLDRLGFGKMALREGRATV